MTDVAIVIRREFTERLRSRTFLVSNGLILLLIVASLVLPVLLGDSGPTQVGVVGDDARAVARIATTQQDTFDVELELVEFTDVAAAEAAIDDGDVDVVLTDGTSALVERSLGPQLEALLSNAANGVQVDQRLTEAGLDADARAELFSIEALDVRSRADDGEVVDPFSPEVMVAFVGVFILYGLLAVYGQWVAQGIVEEKQSRVVELLLSTIRPVELLVGKIAGLGLLGLAQIVLLATAGIIGLQVTGAVDLPSTGYSALVLVVAWYVLGYMLYATLFAMAGAVVARVEDLQSAVMPVIMVLVLALFGAQAALSDPTSTAATVAGLIPFTAPIVQPVLAASGAATGWEMVLAAALAAGTIAVLLPLSGRIYRGGVLATRGRVSFRDAWRSSRAPATAKPRSR